MPISDAYDQWSEGHCHVQSWDVEGFTSAEGVKKPLRVLHTIETTRRRQRVARRWEDIEDTKRWSWEGESRPVFRGKLIWCVLAVCVPLVSFLCRV
jgi:hypothetical protein